MADSTTVKTDATQPNTAESYLQIVEAATGVKAPRAMDTLQADVNELVKQVTVGEDGTFQYPAGTPEHLKLAVATEKKFRDTQSGYTKSQQALKDVEAENKALREQLAKSSVPTKGLSAEEQQRLDDLKYTDPDQWFTEMRSLEEKTIENNVSQLSANQELRRRENHLANINSNRAEPITPDMLDNDIPARINKKMLDGTVTFEDYISEVVEYLDGRKKIATVNPELTSSTNIIGGSAGSVVNGASEIDYTKITF